MRGAPSRRDFVVGAGALGIATALPRPARAAPTGPSHGMSSFGELKYPADFPRFAYANPAAPRGGRFSAQLSSTFGNQAGDTFDTLNAYVLRGNGAAGMNLTFDALMVRALDEPDALYGLVAREVEASEDGLTYRFGLRPQARFHDGSRLTAGDVAFTLNLLKQKGHPEISQVIRDMADAVAEGDETVVVRFEKGRSRDLPLFVATLPIFSKAYYAGRDFEASTLEPPRGSGPYKVGRLEAGRFIEFERVPDYWAADLPVMVGHNNFDQIRYEYFRDRQVAFEAFKGGIFTFREEFTARVWATGYDFPALREGRVRKEVVPDARPSGTQGWWLNTRREAFADPRVREAIGLCFDFTWSNANLMYGAYERTASYFENSDLKATGRPPPEELALLAPLRADLPADVFGEAWSPPATDGSGQDRALLSRAAALLREAGCTREGGVVRLSSGRPLEIEFLNDDPVFEPVTHPFIRNLGLIGIKARIRLADAAQYQARLKDFDFDVVSRRYGSSLTPGPELREAYGSRAAATPGSNNLSGIASPAIDALIDKVTEATSRSDLITAARALDRVLRAGRYWVPMWYKPDHRLALWDVYGHPSPGPAYDLGAPSIWWHDADKARRIGRN
ncbi:extracellular solute-binding protein [Methylobacterium sp. E-045]|uniref:extracellular solute-binding protein n=1 Tax=Methylobacterium sp. E-045 TaxID=2836575 RepID=UPI001FBA0D82|nr:extracellular solute-binding protein [Methylobacterium sp. E-045]MCJ2132119.1 extracellular solute-binding protein [Methylobacterium sp. E-045]